MRLRRPYRKIFRPLETHSRFCRYPADGTRGSVQVTPKGFWDECWFRNGRQRKGLKGFTFYYKGITCFYRHSFGIVSQ